VYVTSPTTSARPLWLWPNLLSLDAPLIAVLWVNLFAAAFHVALAPDVSLTLALVVWLIYAADRLLDGLKGNPLARTSRHEFHRVHRHSLLAAMAAALAVTGYACSRLDPLTFRAGLVLSLAVAAYLGAVHLFRLQVPKEAVVALLFGVGTTFPIVLRSEASIAAAVALALFIVLCWLNLVAIEHSEWRSFRPHPGTPHPSTMAAALRLPSISAGLAVISAVLGLMNFGAVDSALFLAIALSAVALAALSLCRQRLSIELVRVLADAALLTPVFVLPFLSR
jgi:hypothetical protein